VNCVDCAVCVARFCVWFVVCLMCVVFLCLWFVCGMCEFMVYGVVWLCVYVL